MSRYYKFYLYRKQNRFDDCNFFLTEIDVYAPSFLTAERKLRQRLDALNSIALIPITFLSRYMEVYYDGDSSKCLTLPF